MIVTTPTKILNVISENLELMGFQHLFRYLSKFGRTAAVGVTLPVNTRKGVATVHPKNSLENNQERKFSYLIPNYNKKIETF